MKTTLVKILTSVVVYVLTFGVVLRWVGDASTAHAGVPQQGSWISVPAGSRILIRLSETLSSTNQRVGGDCRPAGNNGARPGSFRAIGGDNGGRFPTGFGVNRHCDQ